MKQQTNYQSEGIIIERRKHDRLRRAIAMLSAVVMFFTMNSLKMNADTLERVPTCGIEAHVHSDECYGEDDELICDLEAHEHTDACYQQRPEKVEPAATAIDDFIPLNAGVQLTSDGVVVTGQVYEEQELELGENGIAGTDDEATDLPGEEDEEPFVEVPAVVELPESGYRYDFHGAGSALLSQILYAVRLPLAIEDIEEVSQVQEGEDEAFLLRIEEIEDDYSIAAVKTFDAVELAVFTADHIYTIDLVNAAVEAAADADADEAAEDADEANSADDEEDIPAQAEADDNIIEETDAEETVTEETAEEGETEENEAAKETEATEEDETTEESEAAEETEAVEEGATVETFGNVTIEAVEGTLPGTLKVDCVEGDTGVVDELKRMLAQRPMSRSMKNAGRLMMSAAPAAQTSGTAEPGYAVFDIKVDADGAELPEVRITVRPETPVDLYANVPEGAVVVGEPRFKLYHIHDGALMPTPEDVAVEYDDGMLTSLSFTTSSCSPFILEYTVDFHYSDTDVSIEGGSQVLLSTLIAQLNITDAEGNLIDVNDVASVSFTDERLVTVEEVSGEVEVNGETVTIEGKDFLLTSNEPFTSAEQLVLTLNDAEADPVVVDVTDDQPLDIESLLTQVTITENGTPVAQDATLVKDRVYDVKLSFRETDSLQFVDDGTEMYYNMPSNVTVPNDSGTFEMDFGSFGKVKGNTYSIENGVLKIHWNTSDPNFNILRALDEAHFDVNIKVKFGENSNVVQWNEHIQTNLDITEPHDANISKVGSYDASTGKINYTVTVNSTGSTTGIKVTDAITGSALTSDVHAVTDLDIKKNGQAANAKSFNTSGNGFVVELHDMVDGDQYVIKYSASVQYDKLGKSGKTTYLEANNGVKVEWNESPDPKTDNSYEYDIYYSSLTKGSRGVSEAYEEGGKIYRDLTWRVEANGERKTPVDHITDTIRADSIDIMKMYGTGLTVVVTNEDGTVTRTIDWNTSDASKGSLTKTDTSWTYTPPESDGNASYQITYMTRAEVTNLNEAKTVNNDVEDGHNTTGAGTSVGPDGKTTPSVVKNVTSVTQEETEWSIDVIIPKGATTSNQIIDVLPHYQEVYYDSYKGYTISGLTDNSERCVETFKYRHDSFDPYGNLVISYYDAPEPRNEGDFPTEVYLNLQHLESGIWVDGLGASDSDRTIQVKIVTGNNPDWLTAAEGNYWTYYQHTNTAIFGSIRDTATATPSKKIISKSLALQPSSTDKVKLKDGYEYNYYKYYLVLQGVSSGEQQIFDTFDTEVFDILTLDDVDSQYYRDYNPFLPAHNGIGAISVGDNATTYNSEYDSHVATLTRTDDGVVISTTGLDKQPSGAYYNCYRIAYYLVMKDPEKAAQKAYDAGGKTTFTNSVDWDGATSHVDIEYGHPVLDKQVAVNGTKATYTITINPDTLSLGGTDGEGSYPPFLTLTDTFSSTLSIIYDSIKVTIDDQTDTAHVVSYDYSGNVGTFIVPNGRKVVIKYDCNIISNGKDKVQIWNNADLNGDFVVSTEEYVDVSSSASGGGELFAIKLLKYKENHMEDGPLAGATFRILDSEKNPIVVTARAKDPDSHVGDPITFTTNADSTVTILLSRYTHGVTLKKNTVYYLEEIAAPAGYQLDSTLYSFVISDDPNHANYTREDGVWVYYVGDILKIRNTPEKQQLTLYKRFEGNVSLTDEQKEKIKFTIIQVDENGNEVPGGFRRENINYSDLVYDKYTITEEDEGFVPGYYKVIEEHADAEYLGLDSNVVAETSYTVTTSGTTETGNATIVEGAQVVAGKGTNVIFVNKYSTGAYYFNKIEAGTEEQPLGGAEFTVYDTDDMQITLYTTGEDGKFMISRQGGHESLFDENTLYYVMETKAPEGYSIPDPAPKYYFFFGDGDPTHIPAGATENNAVNLYEGSGTENIINASNTSIMVEKVWVHKDGSPMSDLETKDLEAHVTLRRKLSKLQGTKVTIKVFDDNSANNPYKKELMVEKNSTFTVGWQGFYNGKIAYGGKTSTDYVIGEGENTGSIGIDATGDAMEVVFYVANNHQAGVAFTGMQVDYTPATTYSAPEEDDTFHRPQTLTLADGWYYAWNNLDKTDTDGNPYSYYITEDSVPEGYKFKSFSDNNEVGIQSGTITVTNEKEEDEKGNLKIRKTTVPVGSTQPFTFNVKLTAPTGGSLAESYATVRTGQNAGESTQAVTSGTEFTITLQGGDTWQINDLPAGTAYTVTEKDVVGWKLTGFVGSQGTIEANQTKEASFTNTEYTKVEVDKKWFQGTTDITSQISTSNASLKVKLSAEGWDGKNVDGETVTREVNLPQNDGSWSASWERLPKANASGEAYTYKVTESEVKVSGDDLTAEDPVTVVDGKAVINNTLPTTKLTVTKAWTTQWPKDVASVQATISATGTETGITDLIANSTDANAAMVNLTSDAASKTWNKLPVYDNAGNKITYSVAETSVTMTNGTVYTAESTVKMSDVFTTTSATSGTTTTITNTPKTKNIPVDKVWAFANGSSDWPEGVSVEVKLMKKVGDGTAEEVDTVTLNSEKTSYEFTNLPLYEGMKEIEYSVEEGTVTPLDIDLFNVTVAPNASGTGFTITNTEKQAGLTIIKLFTGATLTDAEKARIKFTVKKSDNTVLAEKTYNQFDENGQWVLTQADGIRAGETYTVVESNADIDKYIRTTTIKVNDGEDTDAGNEITADVLVNAETGVGTVTVTNYYTKEPTEVSGTKTWVDKRTHDNAKEITLKLSRKVEGADDSTYVEVTSGYTFSWDGNIYKYTGLEKYVSNNTPAMEDDEKEYVYKVEETAVNVTDHDETISYKSEDDGKGNFTNTELTKISVEKTWGGEEWPEDTEVYVKWNGKPWPLGPSNTDHSFDGDSGSYTTLTSEKRTAEKTGLPKYVMEEGKTEPTVVEYSVEEIGISYKGVQIGKDDIGTYFVVTDPTLKNGSTTEYIIDNKPMTTVAEAEKIWVGQNGSEVTFTLKNGETTVATVTLDGTKEETTRTTDGITWQEDEPWHVKFTNLPKYSVVTGEGGVKKLQAITYTVEETAFKDAENNAYTVVKSESGYVVKLGDTVVSGWTVSQQGNTITNTAPGELKIKKEVLYNGKPVAELTAEQKSKMAGTYTFTIFTDETCQTAYQVNGAPKTISITIEATGEAVTSDPVTLPAGSYWIKETESTNPNMVCVQEYQQASIEAGKIGEHAVMSTFDNNYSDGPDEAFITVKKTFIGLNNQFPENFELTVKDQNGHIYTLTNRNDYAHGIIFTNEGLVWKWKIMNASAGSYIIVEDGAGLEGFTVTTQGTSENEDASLQVAPADMTLTHGEIRHTCAQLRWYVHGETTFFAALTDANNQSKGTLIVTEKSLSASQRKAIENWIKTAMNGAFQGEMLYYSIEEHPNGFNTPAGIVTYDADTHYVEFSGTKIWKMCVDVTMRINDPTSADFNVTNEYTTSINAEKSWYDEASQIPETMPKNVRVTLTLKRYIKSADGITEDNGFTPKVVTIRADENGDVTWTVDGNSVAPDANDPWKYTWNDLKKFGKDANGIIEYVYRVEESNFDEDYYYRDEGETSDYLPTLNENGSIKDNTQEFNNHKRSSYTLPETGGAGTTLIHVIGTGLLILAAIWFILDQKKRFDRY